MEQTKKRENFVTGIVGAFLGSLIGVVFIVLIGQMGYIASISGVIMAVCALKGYELLGGRLSAKGIAAACVLIVVMTYMGNKLDWAVSAASAFEIGYLDAFRSIEYFLDEGVIDPVDYWFNLILLYLFTLLGAVPTIIGSLRQQDPPAIRQLPSDTDTPEGADAQGPEMQVYTPEKGWVRPLRVSFSVSLFLWLAIGVALLVIANSSDAPAVPLFASLVCILMCFLSIALLRRIAQALQANIWVYVRRGRSLWRVNIPQLNAIDTCRYTAKSGSFRPLRWECLTAEEQERAKASIFRVIEQLSRGQIVYGGMLLQTVIPMTELRVEKDTKWYWLVSYRTESGRRKKWALAKACPGFAPSPELDMPEGPVPFHWPCLAATLLAAAVSIGIVFGGAAVLTAASHANEDSLLSDAADSMPEDTNSYAYHGVTYKVDSSFEDVGGNVFYDGKTEAFYYLTVEAGMDEDSAQSELTGLVADYRTDDTFESFAFAYPEAESVLTSLTAEDGTVYRHSILSLYFTEAADVAAVHSGIALSEEGVLVTVGATHADSRDAEKVMAGIIHILMSIELSEDAGSPTAGVTEENYRSLFHPAEEYGYEQIGCGYIKAPYEMFGKDAFVDVYIPYSEDVEYSEDGYAIRSAAHGMEVYQTIAPSEENAQAVVDRAYEALAASGADIFEDGVYETMYWEEYDIACKEIAYFEGGGELARIAILYADVRQDGHYLYAQITYLPEQMDEDYPALVEELSDVFYLELPQIEEFD